MNPFFEENSKAVLLDDVGQRSQCDLCGTRRFRKVYHLKEKVIVRCDQCGLFFTLRGQVIPKFDNTSADETYREKYDLNFSEFRKKSFLYAFDGLTELRGRLEELEILDLGSSFGHFLSLARERRMRITGIEGSAFEANVAESENFIPTIIMNLNELQLESNKYDVITLWDVLEHLDSPKNVLTKVHQALKKGGVVILRIPIRDSLVPLLSHLLYVCSFGRITFPVEKLFEFHQYHFTTTMITRYLGSLGFLIPLLYRENYINPDAISRKEYGKNLLVAFGLRSIIRIAELLHLQDELVIYGSKK